MKIIGVMVLVVVGCAILVMGKMDWRERIAANKELDVPPVTVDLPQEVDQVVELDLSLAENLPDELIEQLEETGLVSLALVTRDKSAWALRLKEAIVEAYGSDVWDIEIVVYGDSTTVDLLLDDSVLGLNADLILFEAPLLTDNLEEVGWETTFDGTEELVGQWSDSIVWVMPPNPIHEGVNYPIQVEALNGLLLEQGYTVIDHWVSWPDGESEEMLDLLDEDGLWVNESGSSLWLEHLVPYFVAS